MNLFALRQGCAALALCAAAGCTVDGRDDDYDDRYVDGPTSVGRSNSSVGEDVTLSVEWTIDGSNDPDLCIESAADVAYVMIEDDRGLVDEDEVPCEDFAYDSPLLPPGTYWATVVLRDEYGDDRTTPGESDSRDLFDGDSDFVVINFDEDSFL